MECKNCHSYNTRKNGFIRNTQRYKCKDCFITFVEGDKRVKKETTVKKACCVVLYTLAKASFNMLGKIFGHSPSIIYRWVKEAMDLTSEPTIGSDVKEIEFDEMWHFVQYGPSEIEVQKKVKNSGSSKRWIVAEGELLPGLQAIVMLQPSTDFTKR